MTFKSTEPPTDSLSSRRLKPEQDHEATMQKTLAGGISQQTAESCIVQIYPADIVDGMLKLGADTMVLGRDPSVNSVLSDSSVSRRHAEIKPCDTGFEISDLGSTNGTLVNGLAVESVALKSGDTIQIGSFLFRFLTAGSVESMYHETVYSALTRDALTGTMNRRYLLESLKREIARARRKGEVVTVVMVDIDHFKQVNDTYGHMVGDEVLRAFGSRLGAVIREDDLLARFGGEEFCLVLCATSTSEAIDILERCRLEIAGQPFTTAAGAVPVTACFGYTCIDPTQTKTINEVLEEADVKLYEAKSSGRNRVCG